MTQLHPAQLPIERLLQACHVRRQRRSGPGGQHRNKVETGVFIEHTPTGTEAAATETRSQESNRRKAIFRLRFRLALEHRTGTPYEPTELWQQRCAGGLIAINPQHDDFPALLAEVLDVLGWNAWELPQAAAARNCTASQLLKLLRLQPIALNHVNRQRVESGLRPLK